MKKIIFAITTLLIASQSSHALNILISNDDGLTSNVKALYEAFKAEGHQVIVSVPCTGQSGRGGGIVMYSTDKIVADNDKTQIDRHNGCSNGVASIGDPAVGPFKKAGYQNYYYVHGTPIMATMYGLDVVAQQIWAKAPDLILSGPNEGQNVGSLLLTVQTQLVMFNLLRDEVFHQLL